MQILIILIALLVKKPLELDYSPIVVIKVGLKESFAYRRRRHVLPTPLFPIVSSLLEKKRASVGQKRKKVKRPNIKKNRNRLDFFSTTIICTHSTADNSLDL